MPAVFSIYGENRQTYSIISRMFEIILLQSRSAVKEISHVV